MNNPDNLLYTDSHEWLRREADGSVTIGITFHAQDALGELVYVELPTPGRHVELGEAIIVVESTKAASDVYAPVAGEVLAVNETLAEQPQSVNEQPYEAGWLIRLRPNDAQSLERLMSAEQYTSGAGAA